MINPEERMTSKVMTNQVTANQVKPNINEPNIDEQKIDENSTLSPCQDKFLTKGLRQYLDTNKRVKGLYSDMYRNQNYSYVKEKLEQYSKLDNAKFKMQEVLQMMDGFVDPSDPDLDLANSVHAYQTAERIRRDYPDDRAFQICGLIHDLGKILFYFGEPSWSVVGDTFVVGCSFPKSVVYYEETEHNRDVKERLYQTDLGVYETGCGIENLTISYGHDEYLYQVLTKNRTEHLLPDKYLKMIRFHSFYPWHTAGSYREFMREGDEDLLKDVLQLNQYDLYSKEDTDFVLTNQIKDYYHKLLEEFFPKKLNW